MTKEVAKKIVRGITDKIECNTIDIDDWAEFWGFTREEYEEFLDMAIKSLEQTRWIPVTERLPEDGDLILFSTKTDRVYEGRYFDDNTDRQWYSFRDDTFAWNNVVTAWMPLPEPYKAKSEDKE